MIFTWPPFAFTGPHAGTTERIESRVGMNFLGASAGTDCGQRSKSDGYVEARGSTSRTEIPSDPRRPETRFSRPTKCSECHEITDDDCGEYGCPFAKTNSTPTAACARRV